MTNLGLLALAAEKSHDAMSEALRAAGREPRDNAHAERLRKLAVAASLIESGHGDRARAELQRILDGLAQV